MVDVLDILNFGLESASSWALYTQEVITCDFFLLSCVGGIHFAFQANWICQFSILLVNVSDIDCAAWFWNCLVDVLNILNFCLEGTSFWTLYSQEVITRYFLLLRRVGCVHFAFQSFWICQFCVLLVYVCNIHRSTWFRNGLVNIFHVLDFCFESTCLWPFHS